MVGTNTYMGVAQRGSAVSCLDEIYDIKDMGENDMDSDQTVIYLHLNAYP